MKLCFFADGRNLHLQRLAPALAGRGHEVHIVSHKPVPLPGVTIERFAVPEPGLREPFRWVTRQTRYLRGFLRRFDVVIVFFLQDYGFTPELLDGGCLIASPRGSDIVPPPGESLPSEELRQARVALLRAASAVGVAGPSFAQSVAKFAELDPNAFERLPLGVDTSVFRPRERCPKPGSPLRVGFLKGFREVYGAIDLVHAIPAIVKQNHSVMFELVGSGPTLWRCREAAKKLGVNETIRWTDTVEHADVPRLLSDWDISVIPSYCESFGVTALESSALEVPIVANRVGGLQDTVVDGVTGLLVEPGRPSALAESVNGLILDSDRRQRMGAAGRHYVMEHYDWQCVLTQWEAVMQRTRDRTAVMV